MPAIRLCRPQRSADKPGFVAVVNIGWFLVALLDRTASSLGCEHRDVLLGQYAVLLEAHRTSHTVTGGAVPWLVGMTVGPRPLGFFSLVIARLAETVCRTANLIGMTVGPRSLSFPPLVVTLLAETVGCLTRFVGMTVGPRPFGFLLVIAARLTQTVDCCTGQIWVAVGSRSVLSSPLLSALVTETVFRFSGPVGMARRGFDTPQKEPLLPGGAHADDLGRGLGPCLP